ncbi:MAG: ATPase, partial [Nitrososphaerales archaeon]
FSEATNSLLFQVDKKNNGLFADVYVKGDYVTTARVARHGKIKISKRSDAGRRLMRSAFSKNDIEVLLKDS